MAQINTAYFIRLKCPICGTINFGMDEHCTFCGTDLCVYFTYGDTEIEFEIPEDELDYDYEVKNE